MRGNTSLSHGSTEQTNSHIDAAGWSGWLTNEVSLRFIMQCQYLSVRLNYSTPDAPPEGPLVGDRERTAKTITLLCNPKKRQRRTKPVTFIPAAVQQFKCRPRRECHSGEQKSHVVHKQCGFSLNSAGLKNLLCCRTYGLNTLQHGQQKKKSARA